MRHFVCDRARRRAPGLVALLAPLVVLAGCETEPREELPDADPPEIAAPGPMAGDAWADARDRGEAEGHALYVPSGGFAYEDDEGRLTGVTIELLRDFRDFVVEEHGIDLDLTFVEDPDWARFYERVRDSSGAVFGVGNVTITEERAEELSFSPSYLRNVAVLITHEDVPELESLEAMAESFAGMTAASFTGTLHEERLLEVQAEHWPDMPTEEVTSNDEIMEEVSSGEGYFAWVDIYNYWRAAEELPIRRHPVGDDAAEDFGVIMPRDSDWAPVMEEFFHHGDGYVESDRYRELLETHLGRELADLLEEARESGG